MNDYNLLRVDHSRNSKRGGVCIFYKETLGVRIVKSLNFSECIVCEVNIARDMLVLYIGVPAKIVLNLKLFCEISRKF